MKLFFQLLIVIPLYYILSPITINGQKSRIDILHFYTDSLDQSFLFDINKLKMPINNSGILADVEISDSLGNFYLHGGNFDEDRFLYAGGFALSGLDNGEIWANGVMTASRLNDYVAGPIGDIFDSTLFKVYSIRSDDIEFGESWLRWENAVNLGANFYDGNNDGIYNPIDLDSNGIWDLNEDRPDLIGDVTAWCVFNDGLSPSERRFNNVLPQGIEIKQTIFAYSPQTHPELSNVIFIRYNIENTGLITNIFDSVYFSGWSDPDLGVYYDDLISSDTLISSGICYNRGSDGNSEGVGYGTNPPAFLTTLLQGPLTYIPGISYEDENNNDIFDENVDTPIHSASLNYGPTLGSEIITGATKLEVTSILHYIKSDPTLGDPDSPKTLRCYQVGKNSSCEFINPCEWRDGIVHQIDCTTINPSFMYSGDPVTNYGWLCNIATDQRLMVSTGPFILEINKPIEIIFAYIVGRGNDPLNSITVAREIAKDVIGFYESNFTEIPVSVDETKFDKLPTEFILGQNFPNPFNPLTTVNYSIPPDVKSPLQINIFDVLGRKIKTLINKEQKPGNYQIEFDASNFASGVYYYQLKAGNLIQTKKMILLK